MSDTLDATTQERSTPAVRIASWIGASILAACIYSAALAYLARTDLMTMFELGVAFFVLGFALGPLAVVFCIAVLGAQLKLLVGLFFNWIACCPDGNSDGYIGMLLFGSVFVGGSYSSYLLAQLARRRRPQLWAVVAGGLLLALAWLAVVWNASEACRIHACPVRY